MRGDITLAVRLLVKERWFSLAAVFVLALGIAATAMVFTLFNGIFLRALPFDEPERIVVLNTRLASNPDTNFAVPYLDFLDWRAGARAFDGLAAFTELTMNVAGDGRQPARLIGAYVSANAFSLIGQRPALGRSFTERDDVPGAVPVVMLSHATWEARYAADPAVVGRQIRVNGAPATIIGIMPRGVGFPNDAALWQTLAMLPENTRNQRDQRSLLVLGRLAPGVTPEGALADVTVLASALPGRSADPARNFVPRVWTFRDFMIGPDNRIGFMLLLAAVGFVLLIACGNVANLLLARGAVRAREITVRLSLGAKRVRIVRQLLAESVLMATLAAGLGLVLSLAGVRLFESATADTAAPYWLDFSLDAKVWLFVTAVCVATALLSGLMPALHTTRINLAEVLNQAARGHSAAPSQRWTGALVTVQLALTLTLLMSAGVVLRELLALRSAPIGVETADVTVLQFDLSTRSYGDEGALKAFYRGLDERLASLPGVQATYASAAPHGGAAARELTVAGVADRADRRVSHVTVGPRYFEVMGVRPARGRAFTAADQTGVAIVNERLATQYFAGQDPIGKQIRLDGPRTGGAASDWLTIVGVVPDIRQRSSGTQAFDPVLYVPYAANVLPFATILTRSAAQPGAVAARLREELRALDAELPLFGVRSLDDAIAFDRWPLRVFGAMFGTFAAMALLLAAVGLYGVTAYAVSRRTREIGIRIALGALPRQIWWTVTRRAAVQLAIGLVLGTAGSVAVAGLWRTLVTSTSGTDPATLATVSALLIVVAGIACFVPARRAIRLDPVSALRAE